MEKSAGKAAAQNFPWIERSVKGAMKGGGFSSATGFGIDDPAGVATDLELVYW